jgi:iron(III) transport system ATP-binding protein
MADRVVVMNHGVIEQTGTPQQIYRAPASAFVADFVGKVNAINAVAEDGGRFRVGTLSLTGGVDFATVAPGTRVRLYLRPEDIVVNGNAAGHVNSAMAKVVKVEFLGAFCHVTVAVAGAEEQPLLVNISRHSIDRMSLDEGSSLSIGLPPECLRLLG